MIVELKSGIEVTFRPMESQDFSLVMNSWLQGYKASAANHRIVHSVYYDMMSRRVAEILKRAECIIVCMPDTPNEIMGYMVAEDGWVLHWCYVKYPYRKLGIADALFNQLITSRPVRVSHVPALGSAGHGWSNRYFDHLGDDILYDPSFQYEPAQRRAA